MQHDNPWHHLKTKIVYEDEWIVVKNDTVVRPEGTPGNYTYIDTNDSVMMIALNADTNVYLEWTYRYPVRSWGWELPGGRSEKATPLDTAKAELEEECGYRANSWDSIGKTSIYNGLVSGVIHYFEAKNLQLSSHIDADDSELTNTGRFFSLPAIDQMILDGEISDTHTIAGIQLFKLRNGAAG